MGGKLLQKQGARRITVKEYNETFLPALKLLLAPLGIKYTFIEAYREKDSHGNINILMNAGTDKEAEERLLFPASCKNLVMSFLQRKGYKLYVNSNVVSFLFQEQVQVDLIFTPTSKFDYAQSYFAWNDLGGLIGRVARGLGLTHGHEGLYYKVYNEDRSRILGKFLVTANPAEALKLLGYDYGRFLKGFDTLADIFEYAVSSEYFSSKHYFLTSMTSSDRSRDAKRNTFVEFEKYLHGHNLKKISSVDKEAFQKILFKKYPNLAVQVHKALTKEADRVTIASKFNGNIVLQVCPSLKGPSLGQFLANFKENFSDKYILEATPEKILEDIKSFYKTTLDVEQCRLKRKICSTLPEEDLKIIAKALYEHMFRVSSKESTEVERLYKLFEKTKGEDT